jgi:hypothetical protein
MHELSIKFHNVDELLVGLPGAFEFCRGRCGQFFIVHPVRDQPGYFSIIECGATPAASAVHNGLITSLHHEQIPLHYFPVRDEWERLRAAARGYSNGPNSPRS